MKKDKKNGSASIAVLVLSVIVFVLSLISFIKKARADIMENRNYSENVTMCDLISKELSKSIKDKQVKTATLDFIFVQCLHDAFKRSKNTK